MNAQHFLGEFAVRSIVLSIAGLGLLLAARLTHPSWRHAICAFVLGGLLILPPVLLLPGWRVEMGSWAHLSQSAAQKMESFPFGWWLAALWLGGAAWHVVKLAVGLHSLRRLAHQARPVQDARMLEIFHDACQHLQISQAPAFITGAAGQMPLAFGLNRGVVLLPAEAEKWSDDRLDLILLHELGHLKRRDPLLQTLGLLACALHWFNPLVWLFHKRLRKVRELACDAMVIAAGVSPVSYAKLLLENVTSHRSPMNVAGAAFGGSDLRMRIKQLLVTTPVRSQQNSRWLAAAILLLGSGAVLATGFLHPHIMEITAPPQENWTPQDIADRFQANPFPAEPGFVR